MYNINISFLFEWDSEKNTANQKKHGVSFDEAKTIFFDEDAVEYIDLDHSEKEDRFILLGMGARMRVLVVCYCYRGQDTKIRIISARKASEKEEKHYWRLRK